VETEGDAAIARLCDATINQIRDDHGDSVRPSLEANASEWFYQYGAVEAMLSQAEPDGRRTPEKFSEAVHDDNPDKPMWEESISKEWNSLVSLNSFKVVPFSQVPPGTKQLGTKWVFKIKRNKDGSVDKFKSRLTIQGCGQEMGVNFCSTWAPCARGTTIKLLFALAASLGVEVCTSDVSTAFLYADVDYDIYCRAPKGVNVPAGHCLLLLKSVYGIKQAPMLWNQHVNGTLEKFTWTLPDGTVAPMHRSEVDPCLYWVDGGRYGSLFLASSSRFMWTT
jgi:hypothetical protein